ncbi:SLAC1 anion channel family protein [Endozoicomonadaceae bacterium StTr2]
MTQADDNRLEHFPVSFFAIVMGLSGLTLAWRSAASIGSLPEASWLLPAGLASLVMIAVLLVYANKARLYPAAIMRELNHPIRLNFFPAISISLILLGTIWQLLDPIAYVLWIAGAGLQLGFTLYVINCWMHRDTLLPVHANPGWFIPVVGNIIVPIAGVPFGHIELSWFFFSLGMLFWLPLLTIILYRLFFHEPLPQKLMPTWFILLAPPSIGFISYTSLIGDIDGFAKVLIYSAVFLGLLLLSNGIRFVRLPFFISSWAFSFPQAAFTIACFKYAVMAELPQFYWLATLLLGLLTIVILWLTWQTLRAIARGQICKPE